MAQIDILKREISGKFLILQTHLINSLKKQGDVTPSLLGLTILRHARDVASGMSCASLLEDHRQELIKATEIEDVFFVIDPYLSYFNYELLQIIIGTHGTAKDKQNMQQYLNDFSEYCKKVPCVEFDVPNSRECKSTKIKFKLDYDKNQLKLGDVKRIQRCIAAILNLKPSTLSLHCIEDGCVIFTFLMPTSIVNYVMDIIEMNKSILKDEIKLLHVELEAHGLPEVCYQIYTIVIIIN